MMLPKSSLSRPRRLRAKYTPRTNLTVRTPGISLLRRACIECSRSILHIRSREKCCGIFPSLLCRSLTTPAAATAVCSCKKER